MAIATPIIHYCTGVVIINEDVESLGADGKSDWWAVCCLRGSTRQSWEQPSRWKFTLGLRYFVGSREIFVGVCIRGGASRSDLVNVLWNESAQAVDWIIYTFGVDLSLVSRFGGHSMPQTHCGKQRSGMSITYGLQAV